MRSLACLSLSLLVACGGDDGSSTPVDANGSGGSDGSGSASFDTCTGACKTTALTATFGSATKTLENAFYGVTSATGTPPTLYVEIDRGLTTCPEMGSPSPEYSLILGEVMVPSDTSVSSSPGNLLDYTSNGDLLGGDLGQKATTVTLTPVAAANVIEPSGFIAFDTNLVFPDGKITGHFYAEHCASMDQD